MAKVEGYRIYNNEVTAASTKTIQLQKIKPNTGQVHQCWAVRNGQAAHTERPLAMSDDRFRGFVWTRLGMEVLLTLVVARRRSAKRLASRFPMIMMASVASMAKTHPD